MHSCFASFRTDGGVIRFFLALSSLLPFGSAHLSAARLDMPIVTYLSIIQNADEYAISQMFQIDVYLSRLVAQELSTLFIY